MANVVVNADTYVGNHCILNTMASIGHDVLKTLLIYRLILR